ncbi:MAG: flagellar hook-basal body complex protein [Nitriliruptoraceae bacterium]|nr:flagellar hook-basal body complex protein [Nitriliruptoraceae bacterium]
MLRSMFSAISGLRSHQTMMDVTGNNIANVNTSGYKSSRTTFSETLTQLQRGGTAGGAGGAGQNPMQIGLGTQVAATDMVFTQGASQATGRPTDVAIQGDGFFVVEAEGQQFATRAGAFSIDSAGNLVTAGGQRVLGSNFPAGLDPNDPLPALPGAAAALDPITVNRAEFTDITIGSNGAVTGRNNAGELRVLGQIAITRFPNVEGLERVGNGLFSMESAAAGGPILGAPGENGRGVLQAGTLEMSNVDLAQEFTNLILSQRGFQANARTITTSDELLQELVNLKR